MGLHCCVLRAQVALNLCWCAISNQAHQRKQTQPSQWLWAAWFCELSLQWCRAHQFQLTAADCLPSPRSVRMGPYSSRLHQDAVLHASCSLGLVLHICSLVIFHCGISTVCCRAHTSFMQVTISLVLFSLVWRGNVMCDLQAVRKTSSHEYLY